MAAGILSAPGEPYGPCADDCRHHDCALTRKMAASLCPRCEKPIGYDVRFYRVDAEPSGDVLTDATGEPYSLAHALCVEVAIEADHHANNRDRL